MDESIKDLLLNIQLEVKQISNKLDEIEKVATNGNYVYTNTDINRKTDKNKE